LYAYGHTDFVGGSLVFGFWFWALDFGGDLGKGWIRVLKLEFTLLEKHTRKKF
jgi:hypothetical protein